MDGLLKMKWLLDMQRKEQTIFFLIILLPVLLSGCAQPGGISDQQTPIGSIWEVPADDRGTYNWEFAPPIAQEQYAGYTLAAQNLKDYSFTDILASEGNQTDDVQIAIRGMVEDPENPIAAVIGGTSNEATMRAASLVNFFNVPMVIPTADGDNLLPSNNLWAFRLSAPGSAYANYLFGTLLTKAEFGSDPEITDELPRLNIAILYEGNTFGESAAVATVRAAMELGLGVGVYASFPPVTPDAARLNILLNRVETEGIHLVYLISNDPGVAKTLVQLFNSRIPALSRPVLVGQSGGFASQDFIDSPEAEGIYILRQQLVPEDCPANIKSIYEAQTYAAVTLLDLAVEQVIGSQTASTWDASINNFIDKALNKQTDRVTDFREKVRDDLKQTDTIVPCVGKVSFENTGQVKNPSFEVITVINGETIIGPIDDFINAVKVKSLLASFNE